MTPGQITHLASDTERQSAMDTRFSKTAKNGRIRRYFARQAVDLMEQVEALKSAAIGGYHNVECR